MTNLGTAVDVLQLLGEPTRVRLMRAPLAAGELTVAEIVAVDRPAPSPASRPTSAACARPASSATARPAPPPSTRERGAPCPRRLAKVWQTSCRARCAMPMLEDDRERAAKVVRAREGAEGGPTPPRAKWIGTGRPGAPGVARARLRGPGQAGRRRRHRSGDGSVAQLLAPRARSWTCVDRSDRVLAGARARLGRLRQCRLRRRRRRSPCRCPTRASTRRCCCTSCPRSRARRGCWPRPRASFAPAACSSRHPRRPRSRRRHGRLRRRAPRLCPGGPAPHAQPRRPRGRLVRGHQPGRPAPSFRVVTAFAAAPRHPYGTR